MIEILAILALIFNLRTIIRIKFSQFVSRRVDAIGNFAEDYRPVSVRLLAARQ